LYRSAFFSPLVWSNPSNRLKYLPIAHLAMVWQTICAGETNGTLGRHCRAAEESAASMLSDKRNNLVTARRFIMKNAMIAIATICLLWTTVTTVRISEAATTFTGSIIGIDQAQRTITFQTVTGQTWTISVADSNILKQQVAKGDQVMIDVELDDSDMSRRITKITKIPRSELFEPLQPPEAFRP
jgi:hypothetical protein